jgi:hypothetical protein
MSVSKGFLFGQLSQKAATEDLEILSSLVEQKADAAEVTAISQTANTPVGATTEWGVNDAPILIVLGQSNSYGHGTSLTTAERITTPLANVRTLSRDDLYNLTFESVDNWVGFTSFGTKNIATTSTGLGAQDHTVSLATEFARSWQNHINAGNDLSLPDLYVIEAGWGSQGLTLGISSGRWAPDRDPNNVESLFPRITKAVRLAVSGLKAQGKTPRILAVHWNQWETEASAALSPESSGLAAAQNFERIIQGFNDALGASAPWVFYRPVALSYGPYGQNPDGTDTKPEQVLKSVLSTVAADPVRRRLMDTTQAPTYTGAPNNFGIFLGDNVHYNAATQTWFANVEFNRIEQGWRGVYAGLWPNGTQGLREIESRIVAARERGDEAFTKAEQVENAITTTINEALANASEQTAWQANKLTAQTLDTEFPLPGTIFQRVGTDMVWDVARDTDTGRKIFSPSCPSGGNKQGFLIFSNAPTDAKYGALRFVARGRVPIAVALRAREVPVSFRGLGWGYAALSFYDFGSVTTNVFAPNKVVFWQLRNSTIRAIANGQDVPYNSSTAATDPVGYVFDETVWREWDFGLLPDNGGTAVIRYRPEGGTEADWVQIYEQQNIEGALTGVGLDEGRIGVMVGLGITDSSNQVARWADTYGALKIRSLQFQSFD